MILDLVFCSLSEACVVLFLFKFLRISWLIRAYSVMDLALIHCQAHLPKISLVLTQILMFV